MAQLVAIRLELALLKLPRFDRSWHSLTIVKPLSEADCDGPVTEPRDDRPICDGHRADGGASTCEEAHGTEGGIMKLSVVAAVLGLIVAMALGVAAANGSAKTNPLHVSMASGIQFAL
jgi:hypothetical protein